MPQQTMYRVGRNLPYPEESQHVVDTIGIEILGHLTETTHPPTATVLEHDLPIISRKAPVLAVDRKIIGRRTGLAIQIKVVRLHPSFHTVATDTYGNVSLQNDSLRTGIIGSRQQLFMQAELYIIIVRNFLVGRSGRTAKSTYVFRPVFRILRPCVEIGRPETVAQHAKRRIGHQPIFVPLEKSLKTFGGQHFFTLTTEHGMQIFLLQGTYRLVVHLGQSIQSRPPLFVFRHFLFVRKLRQLAQIDILGMERINGNTIIWIRVQPILMNSRVVHGQQLNDAHPGKHRPIDHSFQVAEIPHPATAFATQ